MNKEEKLKEALEQIRKFGYKNSGYGYSCARLADKCLKEIYGENK